ncbi:MAG: hypothetical protein ACFFAA_05525 [Promethearchaeota archaeon]
MKKFIRKIFYRKYKKDQLVKNFEEERFKNLADRLELKGGQGCGLGR